MTERDKKIQSKQMKKISLHTWCWFSQTELKISLQIKKIWNHEKKQETEKRKNLWSEKFKRENHTEQTIHCKTYSSSDDRQNKMKMTVNKENNRDKNNNNDDSSSDSNDDSDKLGQEIFTSKQSQQKNQNQN